MYKKNKAAYKITAEMLSILLFKEIVNIEHIEFDKAHEILKVFVSGDKYPEMREGDEHIELRMPL